jgi:phage-related protein
LSFRGVKKLSKPQTTASKFAIKNAIAKEPVKDMFKSPTKKVALQWNQSFKTPTSVKELEPKLGDGEVQPKTQSKAANLFKRKFSKSRPKRSSTVK